MTYKGYTGICSYDENTGFYYGEVTGIRDVITLHTIDFFLDWCEVRGKIPEKVDLIPRI